MIQRSFNHKYRTAALVGAAVVFSATSAVSVQAQALANLFGGTKSDNTASVTGVVTLGQTGTGALGSNYAGTVTTPLGVLGSISETVNSTAAPNDFELTTAGVTNGGTFNASASIGSAGLQPNSFYQLSFTSTNNNSANLLSNAGFVLTLQNGTVIVNTLTGLGILNTVNVLGLIDGANNAVNVVFETPASVTAGSALNVAFEGTLGTAVGTGNPELIISGASINQVPEPGTVAMVCMGLVGLAFWRSRHRVLFA